MLGGQGWQLPLKPRPEAGTSESCLPGLAVGEAGGGHLSPWPAEQRGPAALPRADELWWLGGEGTGRRGHLLLRGRHLQLVWPGVVWQTGRTKDTARGPEPRLMQTWSAAATAKWRGGVRGVSQGQRDPQVQPPSLLAQEPPPPL